MAEMGLQGAPYPSENLRIRFTTIEPGTIFHRFHMSQYPATVFNGTDRGHARFSPIRNRNGDIIPTLYGAETFDCAAMETIFRDLAHIPSPRHIDMKKLAGYRHSQVQVKAPLKLVDLTTKSLTALGLFRTQLIDTDASQYPFTRKWAEAIHASAAEAQGLTWVSRQDDTARVVVLFGDRVGPRHLDPHGPSLDLLEDDPTFSALLDLLDILDASAEF